MGVLNAVLLCHTSRRYIATAALGIACFSAGLVRSVQWSTALQWPFKADSVSCAVTAVVAGEVAAEDRVTRFPARVIGSVAGRESNGKLIQVTARTTTRLECGDTIIMEGYLQRPSSPGNPGEMDQRVRAASIGVWAYYYCLRYRRSPATDPRPPFTLMRAILACKHRMEDGISRYLSRQTADLAIAMLFGNKSWLDEQILEDMRANGVCHVLAVSGLHVGFICGALKPLKWVLQPREFAFANTIGLWIYALMAGASPSILRATIMFSLTFLQLPALRKRDGLASLGLSGLVICVFQPLAPLDIGFQLSYLATLGILLIPVSRSKATVFKTTLYATAAVAPLVFSSWNSLPLISPVANCILVPMAGSLVIGAGAVGLLALIMPAMLLPVAGRILGSMVNAVGYLFVLTASLLARLPFSSVPVPSPSPLSITLYYALLAVVSGLVPVPRRYLKGTSLLLIIGLAASLLSPFVFKPFCQVTFIDVGQGDCILVESRGARALIDTGALSPSGSSRALSYLRRRGIMNLDYVFISHWHSDHSGAFREIEKQIRVAKLISPLHGSGHFFNLGEATIEVLSGPSRPSSAEANESSMVLRVRCGPLELLSAGDLSASALERSLIRSFSPGRTVRVLKVSHHGAKDPGLSSLLKRMSPQVCVVSVGRNSFGHPDPSVMSLLGSTTRYVLRTDLDGAITIRIGRNGSVQLSSFKSAKKWELQSEGTLPRSGENHPERLCSSSLHPLGR
ncbi:MAG TPA: DUF4131 domain-containing protein [Firmicutes bacterium]|nr:DUF4131 domain-containing protein [Bacillota bacterium]